MDNNIFEEQIKKELKNMDQRLCDLEEMSYVDIKLSQVIDAILLIPLVLNEVYNNDI